MQGWQQTEQLEKCKENKLSIYRTGKVSVESLAQGIKFIRGSKPELSNDWYDVLEIMLDQNGFTDQRFKDAVQVMISTCVYPKPSHADILSYDKFIDAYTWEELLTNVKDASNEYRGKYLESFVRIIHYGEERWCKKEDAIKYKLELWKRPTPIKLVTREEIIPALAALEEVESEEAKNMSLTDLVKSMKFKPEKIGKKLTQQEREERKKKFNAILEAEK